MEKNNVENIENTKCIEYIVSKEDEKTRLDVYLAKVNKDITRSYIKTLVEKGSILVNDKKLTKAGYILKENDKILVALEEKVDENIVPQNIKLDIIYEDDDVIVVNKEKGMVVHPANGNYEGTLVNALMYSHKDKLSSINGEIRPGIVHRIDKDTSRNTCYS